MPGRRQPVPGLSSANRSSRRSSSCATPSASTRAAASSIASGIPSSRVTSAATTGPVWPSSANRASTRRARSANNATASARPASAGSSGPGRASGPSRYRASPATAQRLPAGRQHPHIITRGQQPGAQLRGRADHMLAVIQHQQQLLAGQHPRQRLADRDTWLLPYPQRRRHRPETCAGSRTGASSASHVPSANRPATARATWSASRVLPTPPGPVTVTSRCSIQQTHDLAHGPGPADEARQHGRETMHATCRGGRRRLPHPRTIMRAAAAVQPAPHRTGTALTPPW